MLWIEKFQVYSMDLDGYLLYAETFRAVFWALLLLLARDAGFISFWATYYIYVGPREPGSRKDKQNQYTGSR